MAGRRLTTPGRQPLLECRTRDQPMAAPTSPIQELTAAAISAREFWLKADFDLPGRAKKTLRVEVYGKPAAGGWAGNFVTGESTAKGRKWGGNDITDVESALRQVASQYPQATLRPDSVKVSVSKGATTGARLKPVAVQA